MYKFKAEMHIDCSPVEILKNLVDVANRNKWDFGMKSGMSK